MDYKNCKLCPRSCGVDRTTGQFGFCGMPDRIIASKAMLHYGEEPAIASSYGTGAVFFSGCTLKCRFCQNEEISLKQYGKGITSERLREIFEELIEEGAQSIDLVTPTHFLPSIIPALYPKLPVPIVYNCGGYESVETLKALDGLVDIYLPDFKYSDNRLGKSLSKCSDYFETTSAAIMEMYGQVGSAVIEDDIMQKGMIVRHLVLPGFVDNSLGVIDWFAKQFPKHDVYFSLMSQYVPKESLPSPLNRRITEEEYAACVSWLELCGIKTGWLQDFSSATQEYLPQFDLSGL